MLMRRVVVGAAICVAGLEGGVGPAAAQDGTSAPAAAGAGEAPIYDGLAATRWLPIDQPGTLYGTPGDDVLVGSDGDDIIYGLGGNDYLCGSPNDAPNGGDDTLYGGIGDDFISDMYGLGNVADGGAGDDGVQIAGFAKGGSGNDSLDVYLGIADGGSGDDVVSAFGAKALSGGSGRDVIINYAGFPSIDCGSGVDDVAPGQSTNVRRCEQIL